MKNLNYAHFLVSQKIRFWLSFAAGLVGFGYILFLGAYTFRGSFDLQLSGWVLALVIVFSWLTWRWVIRRDGLPRTGLEGPLGLVVLVVGLSLLASPDIRQGWWRAGWICGYVLIFYGLVNLLGSGVDRWGLLAAAATVTGLALFQAVAETWQWYRSWWEASGGFELPEVIYRFRGLLTSCIPLMALAVLFVPLMLVGAWRLRQPPVRVLTWLWLGIYAITVPFSSSRSAWLGLAVALLVGGALWAEARRPWRSIGTWSRRRKALVGIGAVILVGIGVIAAFKFIQVFAAHPTHGGDPFGVSGRDVFWNRAVQIWQSAPWLGTGPGRFALEYLRVEPAIPPGFWPVHAHSVFFQVLAEFGWVGLAAWLILLIAIARWGWQRYRGAAPELRPWVAAILAGLAGLLTHLFFDDLTDWMAVMVPAIFLLAWVGTSGAQAVPVFRRISLGWLGLPAMALIVTAGWGLWAYQPFTHWGEAAMAGDWRAAAESAAESARRDPNFHFYQSQAGLIWAWEWHYQNDPEGLSQARRYLRASLSLEPAPSWLWADLGVLDAAAGDLALGIEEIRQAVQRSPGMAAYHWNLAKLYEENGQSAAALASYRQALDLKPDWKDLPFWTETPLRREALAGWKGSAPAAAPFPRLDQARAAIAAGQFDLAARRLAQSRLLQAPEKEVLALEISLAERQGDRAQAERARAALKRLVESEAMSLDYNIAFLYPRFLANQDGVDFITVPGLMPEISVPEK